MKHLKQFENYNETPIRKAIMIGYNNGFDDTKNNNPEKD